MSNFEFIGTVKVVLAEQSFPSGFSKRELVVTSEDERYPQDVVFEFVNDKMDLLKDLKESERVKVSFDIRGREYNERYFVNLRGWRIEKLDASSGQASVADAPGGFGDDFEPDDLTDDTPF